MLGRILKTEAVKEEILRLIRSKGLKQGDHVCSEKELMSLCEVSRITIRRAIARLSYEGIVFSVHGKGTFVGNKAGLQIPQGRNGKTVEMVTPILYDAGMKEAWGTLAVMSEIENGIKKRAGYKLILSNTYRDPSLEKKTIEDAISGSSSAIIFEPIPFTMLRLLEEHIGLLVRSGKPFVVSERLVPFEVDNVYEDDFYGAFLATSHLIEHGHRSILHINFSGEYLENRRKGYKSALMERGLTVNENLIYNGKIKHAGGMYLVKYDDFHNLGYRAVKETLRKGQEFSAIFAVNDNTAIGAMEALNETGLKVPGDVSIVGYDNLSESEKFNFTSVERQFVDMGKMISRVIVEKLERKDPAGTPVRIGIKPRLVERGSVGPRRTLV